MTSDESAEEEEREHDTPMEVDDPDPPMAETTADEPGQAERDQGGDGDHDISQFPR